jgi:asparagine synthase (glutamine-hydrolysing)
VIKPALRQRLLQGGPLEPYAHSIAESYLESFFAQVTHTDPVAAAMHVDLRSFLPGDMLVKVDRMSMAVSLEVRSPLLDQEVVDFTCRLPGAFKIRGLRSKALLKRLAERSLPRSIIQRRKRGFRVPVTRWFREEHRDTVRDLLLDPKSLSLDLFDRGVLYEMLNRHATGERDYSRELFTLVTLEHARELFLTTQVSCPPSYFLHV